MKHDVLVCNEQEGSYTAMLLGWPKLSVSGTGTGRQEAQGTLPETSERRLVNADMVTLGIDLPRGPNRWIRLATVYQDHPLLDDLLAEMAANRSELDTEESFDVHLRIGVG